MIKGFIQLIKNDRNEILFACLVYLACQPYFVWQYGLVYPISTALIIVLFFSQIDLKIRGNRLLLLLFCSAYLLLPILRQSHIATVVMYLSLAIIPCLKQSFIIGSYSYFRLFLILTFSFSIITLLLLLGGVALPYDTIEPLNQLKQYGYIRYPFLVIPSYLENSNYARFCSVFDEPGVIGTIAGLILCVEKFNLKRIGNLIIFIAGCLSASLYFVIISFTYIFFFYQGRAKFYFVIALILFYLLTKDVELFQNLVWDRLTVDDSGSLQGDNRNDEILLKKYNALKYDPRIIIGFGSDFVNKYAGGSASIQLFILRDGLLFVTLFICGYTIMAINYLRAKSNIFFFITVVLLGTLYQRPGFCNPEFLLLFTAYIYKNDKTNGNIGICNSCKL